MKTLQSFFGSKLKGYVFVKVYFKQKKTPRINKEKQ